MIVFGSFKCKATFWHHWKEIFDGSNVSNIQGFLPIRITPVGILGAIQLDVGNRSADG